MIKKWLKITFILILLYVGYVLISTTLVFKIHTPTAPDWQPTFESGENESDDRVMLVQDRFESGMARIQLIDHAEQSIEISSYAVHEGKYADLFFGALFEAADRGVHVRILLDGIVNKWNSDLRELSYAMFEHPNMEYQFYEPLNLLKPWTWNNRYHDKLLVIDNEMVMVGGRNIGDRYFGPEGAKDATNDRDVIVMNTDEERYEQSVLFDVGQYYDMVWNHDYTKAVVTDVSKRQRNKGKAREQEVKKTYQQAVEQYPQYFLEEVDWLATSFPANQVKFLHSPIERLNKEPIIWLELIHQLENASGFVYMESPYIIPTKKMLAYLEDSEVEIEKIKLMTNSFASTPNAVAFSGYYPNRDHLAVESNALYEFQSNTESLHGKTYIFDQKISLVGSFNLDARSTFLNTEVMVLIDSEPFARHLQEEIDYAMEQKSLRVLGDGYEADPNVEEADVSGWKVRKIKALSYITRFFDYLL
ncbi:phospholipase D-like domain-containing protein [Alkalihalobacillus sp. 1P02AB]|uniref:phospholipase D-like domain-containing protein n=1 Tax=Alkalihalobacillus sp. 1P02AB TaxID=3132260 RepID=UPI0039A70B52